MSVPAAYTAAEAPGAPGSNGVGAQGLERIPRQWKRDAIRVLLDMGYQTTANQALRLLSDWQEWRRSDAERFIAEEFRLYVKRRGDLMQIRGKRHHDWRTHT